VVYITSLLVSWRFSAIPIFLLKFSIFYYTSIYSFDVYTDADPSIPKYPKGFVHHVVMKLVQPLLGKGYVVHMDNLSSIV